MKSKPCFRSLIAAAFSLLSVIAAVAADFPTELKLTNGATLHRVSVVRWEKDQVILKHAAGVDPIRYDHIDATQRATVLDVRDAAALAAANQPAQAAPVPAPAPKTRKITGEAFLAGGESQGIRVKFAGLKIVAYPLDSAVTAFNTLAFRQDLPEPIAQTEANGEGQWSLELPAGTPFLLHAKATHHAARGGRSTEFEWRIKSTDIAGDTLMLTEKNAEQPSGGTIR
jgi:hypothetical protein